MFMDREKALCSKWELLWILKSIGNFQRKESFWIHQHPSDPVAVLVSYSTFRFRFLPERGGGYIEHRVSKFDTLAGIAIKYGVEVADVKKMNGLVADLQMFALKSLQIPLPGRHPPSPCLSNAASLNHGEGCSCRELEPPNHSDGDVFDSFHSLRLKSSEKKVSPAMSSLQGYYGLKPANRTVSVGGCLEMGNYKTEENNGDDSHQYLRPFPSTNTPLNHHRKSRSLVNALLEEVINQSPDNNNTHQEQSSDKFRRRRQNLKPTSRHHALQSFS
ncbi:hypothetical protein Bca52824_094841 [Brassica carinata]|uniref:LysM domain-containing protein n=1 Tax=Brassica carinata TaxID=52824 RepID=A0A8X7TIT8_BRACI|nr:hypothetical protein Bca52824_094841 [Brassica carinata]